MMQRDFGLDVLLELSGTEYTQENGYWYKIEAFLVQPTPQIPHGIRYNLTLHDNHNKRILGFDNAHAVMTSRKRYKGRIIHYDHTHKTASDSGRPYAFVNAEQLLLDFFTEVNKILSQFNTGV